MLRNKLLATAGQKNRPKAYFLFRRSASFLIVPIFLSDRVSRPSGLRMVPGGRSCFFSNVPTVQSLRIFLAILLYLLQPLPLFHRATSCMGIVYALNDNLND